MNTKQITDEIQELRNSVNDGNANPLSVYISLKALASELDEVLTEIQPLAVQERAKHAGKRATIHGVVVELREGTRRWSYPEFTPYNQAKERAKSYEKMMQQVATSNAVLADAETGEIVPAAVCTFSKETIAILTGSK